jgi:alpha-1,3-rhamnosyl/mannosyltransferase
MPLSIALDYRPALLSSAGIGRAVRELAAALSELPDLDVHLFGHSLARARRPVEPPPRAALHRLPIPGRALPALARAGLGADRLAGGTRVFHWTDFVMPPVSRAAALLTVHDLAFVRNAEWHGPDAEVLRARTRAAISRAAAVLVPSRSTAADLRAFAPDAARVRVVPFGADHVPAPSGAHPFGGRPYALCVGTIEPRKNHAALLAAWRCLPPPRPLLVVVGGIGWQCEEIVQALRGAVAEGLASWRTDAGDGELWLLLQHAEMLVYPSLWEGFGFPPLEAMQSGVPVVAHDVDPMRELGDGALALVDTRDQAAFADAILRVLHDDTLRRRLQEAGRRRAAAFRWRDCAAAHAAAYREVAR